MKVSLNWVKEYIDIPVDLTNSQIAYDLTMRTVEVEDVVDTAEKFHDVVVGKITAVNAHPNADKLRVCMVDIGEAEDVQIVCGGSNLYEGEKVVVSKPGAEVYWHGENELMKIKETKMRGVTSYGMICGAEEVYLEDLYPTDDPTVIVDLGDIDAIPGQNIADVIGMNDTVLEIDNKSLTNRPDLWGHYGIARELAAIYKLPLKPLDEFVVPEGLKDYDVEIDCTEKCYRYACLEIRNLSIKESPLWMKTAIINGGMRPINAIVDITNYIMLSVGQPTHAFDRTHVTGGKIIVRNAKSDEKLELLDGENIELTPEDLVICDVEGPIALAGIRGGKKDSILDDTVDVVLEVANFTAGAIRNTGKRFDEKTDASIRYEKGIDTQRVNQGLALGVKLFKEIFPEAEFTAFKDVNPVVTKRAEVHVTKAFLDTRLGKVLDDNEISDTLRRLGFDVEFNKGVFHTLAPTWRSTGDISMRDDVLGEIARLIGYENFEAKPLPVNFESAVHQIDMDLNRHLREHLAFRCGFNEIFTYPWIDEKYIKAAKIDMDNGVRLATPPAPELATLRQSLVPGALEAVVKNLRYYDEFKIFEVAEVFEKGEFHPSSEDETLPVHKLMLTGAMVGKDAKSLFYETKGVVESLPRYCHMNEYQFKQIERPSWADSEVYLNILNDEKEIIGSLGLISVATLSDAGVKKASAAVFELDVKKLVPFTSRTNEFVHLPQFPLVEEDLSLLADEDVKWEDIYEAIKYMAKEVSFIEEYRGSQIPEGKKSIMLRIKLGNDDSTMTAKQIEKKTKNILNVLAKKTGVTLREE
ncbi:phenylalanine--tRNA ligase subunit beta [Mogibacterium neglectum]|uniref:phenylalanine--tRNA ligase subunit beta n=1 Tax=Mogibacterium neglectum TaxID=114528 RepID=UPI00272A74A8|nr:phenylalanine--tRNA ligase subunit beta [Mogibacterium neglectum]WLD76851.1 phenylalanine--tRNA ligase subunit beta [Mogibacterium neglectum]